jgi:P27 family predicted phage terminase small subunit
MKGRKPKPTHLKLLAGNPGHRPLNEAEPKPKGDLAEAPAWMTDAQRAIWAEAISHAPPGLLKKLDGSVFTAWVVALDFHRQATIACAVRGLMTTTREGEAKQNPLLAVVNRQAVILVKCASELGFTPVARTRIAVGDNPPDGNGENPFARWKR